MGLSRSQGRLLYLTNYARYGSKPKEPERNKSEIQADLIAVNKKIEETPKNYNTYTKTNTTFDGMIREDLTVGTNTGNFIEAQINLNKTGIAKLEEKNIDLSKISIKTNDKTGVTTLNFKNTNASDYQNVKNALKVETQEEVTELIMTPELKKLYDEKSKLEKELDNATVYEAMQQIYTRTEPMRGKTESLAIPNRDTLLANNGININRSTIMDEIQTVDKALKLNLEDTFNTFG